MNTFYILLVEDNLSFALEIEMLIKELGYGFVGQVDNAKDAIDAIQKQKPNLVLMDIGIKGQVNGIELANSLGTQNIPFIFITQSRDRATYENAQSLKPLAYLVKPFDLLTLQSTIEQAVRVAKELSLIGENEGDVDQASFYIRNNNVLNRIRYSDIFWIKSDGNYCNIHTESKKFVTKISLVSIMRKMEKLEFIRVHKQYIVPLRRIENINLFNNLLYIGEKKIPIGRSYKSSLVRHLDLI
jgi:Response regulator of the LytR/AlgR family